MNLIQVFNKRKLLRYYIVIADLETASQGLWIAVHISYTWVIHSAKTGSFTSHDISQTNSCSFVEPPEGICSLFNVFSHIMSVYVGLWKHLWKNPTFQLASRSHPVPAEMILWLCVIALPQIRKKKKTASIIMTKKILSLLLLKRIYHADKIVLPGARSAQKIFFSF